LLLHGLGYTKVHACLNMARGNRELITNHRNTGQASATQIPPTQANTLGSIARPHKATLHLRLTISGMASLIARIQSPWSSFLSSSRLFVH
jgi:hypothetical protein